MSSCYGIEHQNVELIVVDFEDEYEDKVEVLDIMHSTARPSKDSAKAYGRCSRVYESNNKDCKGGQPRRSKEEKKLWIWMVLMTNILMLSLKEVIIDWILKMKGVHILKSHIKNSSGPH